MSQSNPQPTGTTVLARYAGMAEARRAFNALQNHGVDASDIRLAGREAEASRRQVEAPGAYQDVDRRMVRHVGPRVVLGGLSGALVGAAFGLVFAAAVTAAVDVDASGWLFVFTMGFFAALGSALGAFITFERSVGYDDTWELTLGDETGDGVWVAVRVHREDDASEIVDTLRRDEPALGVEVRRTAPEGVHTVRW